MRWGMDETRHGEVRMNQITTYIAEALAIFLVAVSLYAWWQHHLYKEADHIATVYAQQMNELEQDAVKANKDAGIAWGIANKAMADASEKQQKIMKENVSKDCEKAMKWGLEQARGL